MNKIERELQLSSLEKGLREKYTVLIVNSFVLNKKELHLEVPGEEIRSIASHINVSLDCALISMIGTDQRNQAKGYGIDYVFASRKTNILIVVHTIIDPSNPSFISIADLVHASTLYEREIHDLFGLTPVGHPDAKPLIFHGNWPKENYPLRKDYPFNEHPGVEPGESIFRTILGEGVYEIPVGPVHAGIIEPGHFRFSLAGEPIQNLEAQLYYTHKGIEKLAEGMSIQRGFYLSERISGDETFTNSLAYCMAVEQITGITPPERGLYLRVIYAELERIICHLGDLAGICLDVAFGFGAFQFRLLRNWCYQLADLLCGSRFLRSVNVPGGVRIDRIAEINTDMMKRLQDIQNELEDTIKILHRHTMLTDRIEHTGVLAEKIAFDLNIVGPAARASGIPRDIRKDLCYGVYNQLSFQVPVESGGDVASRMNIKIEECYQSLSLISQALMNIPQGEIKTEIPSIPPFASAFGITESPRGENVHWLMTDQDGLILRYKVRTPSFCNWPGVCHAVSGNIVPDFPLINKSFNLSYAGNDL